MIDMIYGRKDATTPECCVDEGNLPAGNAPFPDADTPQEHIRNVFYRMGFGGEGIVAFSGAPDGEDVFGPHLHAVGGTSVCFTRFSCTCCQPVQ